MEQRQPRPIGECETVESIKEEMANLEPIIDKWFSAYLYYDEMYTDFQEKLDLMLKLEETKQEGNSIEAN
jgi:hypothetical protein